MTFVYTGSEQCYVALAGPSSVNVEAVGGQGGTPSEGGTGGMGAVATGTVPVSVGEVLYVEVGGNGSKTTRATFSGGGGGGIGYSAAGSGGGESDLRTVSSAQSGSLSSVLLLAGGGGGGGEEGLEGAAAGNGGASGSVGEAGGVGQTSGCSSGGGGGGGGTSSAGGTGGTAGGVDGRPGGSGAADSGGAGASGTLAAGGGGGGGYFGGGGGGDVSNSSDSACLGGGGGGGGGSSFAATSVQSPSFATNSGGPVPEVLVDGFVESTSAIASSLQGVVPSASAPGRIGSILSAGRFSRWLLARYPGTLLVDWFTVVRHDGHPRTVLVGQARTTYRTPSFRRVNVILTPAGRKRLRAVNRLTVTIRATFTPRGHRSITISRTIVLRRRPAPIHDRAAPGPRHDEVHANTGVVPYWSWAWSHQR